MQFTKMHGIGNDYVYVDCFASTARRSRRTGRPSAIGISASAPMA